MSYLQYSLPLIAAVTGWITNFIAVKMLFRPKKPIKLLFFTIQGVFPKRQDALAEKIGKVVGEELVSISDLKNKMTDSSNHEEVIKLVDAKIEQFLRTKLVASMPMLAMIMSDQLHEKIKGTLMAEIEALLPEVIASFADKMESQIDVKGMVEEKVKKFSVDKLEEILLKALISKRLFSISSVLK